jgi:hypothetical protein
MAERHLPIERARKLGLDLWPKAVGIHQKWNHEQKHKTKCRNR